MRYLALLRGINVGGKNIIKMTELKACLESIDLENITTYIQSGNVIFDSSEKDPARLITAIHKVIAKTFKMDLPIVVLSLKQMQKVVNTAPKGFGAHSDKYRYDVIFLQEPLTPGEAMKEVTTKEGVDEAWTGKDVLYFSRLTAKAAQSHLSRIVGKPIYKNMTIRNWNTTTKLLKMMAE